MSIAQISVAAALAISLANMPAATPMHPLGIVTEANEATLSNSSVSAGATLCDGDRLSTEPDGALRLRSAAAMIYLSGSSDVILRSMPENEKSTEAELTSGTLIFSTRQAAAIEVRADDAFIRPAADGATVGQIIIAGPKKLYVYARRGSLIFLYHDESELIAEGESFRVPLDPPDEAPAAKLDAKSGGKPDAKSDAKSDGKSDAKSDEGLTKRPARRRRGFLFFL